MDTTDKIILLQSYMQIWNPGNESLLDNLADPQIEVSYPHFEKTVIGIPDYKTALQMTHKFFPDLKINIHDLILGLDKNTVTWEYSGTHTSGELFGIKASGKKVTVQGISILVINEDKIVREYGIVDNLGMIRQLGKVV